jgi:hypothetical protein
LHALRLRNNFIIVNNPDKTKPTIPMRRNSTSAMGALHPVLFFLVIYGISLFLAIFVCRTVYYSINDEGITNSTTIQSDIYSTQTHTTALK